jgi:hypothetical protein
MARQRQRILDGAPCGVVSWTRPIDRERARIGSKAAAQPSGEEVCGGGSADDAHGDGRVPRA